MSRESKTSMPFVSKHCVQISVDKSKYEPWRGRRLCGLWDHCYCLLEHFFSFCDVIYKYSSIESINVLLDSPFVTSFITNMSNLITVNTKLTQSYTCLDTIPNTEQGGNELHIK